MKQTALLALLLVFAHPLVAQEGDKVRDMKEAPSADGSSKATDDVIRRIRIPEVAKPQDKKKAVADATNRAESDIQKLGIKGKSAKTYKEAMIELAESENEIMEKAAKRHNEVIGEMAVTLSKLAGKRGSAIDSKLYLLIYGAINMNPAQYRELREDRYERDNAFTRLVVEVGKDMETVRTAVTELRTSIMADNPWTAGQRVNAERSKFNGTIKNIFTPEEYFKFLEVKGIDRPQQQAASRDLARALRKMTLTDDQRVRLFRVLRNRDMDDGVRREKVNEILTDAQRRELARNLGESKDESKK
ncbi:MAG: hypothetical protein KDB07_01100 [Planctomycetes bacterium]|nr:hypothetical protein [Planctomycetota bacterium]